MIIACVFLLISSCPANLRSFTIFFIIIGLFTNLPIIVGPGMGVNTFFAYELVSLIVPRCES